MFLKLAYLPEKRRPPGRANISFQNIQFPPCNYHPLVPRQEHPIQFKGERKARNFILYWSLKLLKKFRFEVKSKKKWILTFESDEKSPKLVVIFKIERPPFWTSFLPVTSLKGMSAATVTSLCTCIVQGNKILWRIELKLLGLWLRSSLVLLNPCETVRSQRKTMFTRVKMSAEEVIHRIVYASVVR